MTREKRWRLSAAKKRWRLSAAREVVASECRKEAACAPQGSGLCATRKRPGCRKEGEVNMTACLSTKEKQNLEQPTMRWRNPRQPGTARDWHEARSIGPLASATKEKQNLEQPSMMWRNPRQPGTARDRHEAKSIGPLASSVEE